MKFKYKAKTKEGELQVGLVEAGSRDAATTILTGHDLFLLSLVEAEGTHWYDRVGGYMSRVTKKDLLIFTRQLATLLEARFPLTEALKTIYQQSGHRILKEAAYEIARILMRGLRSPRRLSGRGIFSPPFL